MTAASSQPVFLITGALGQVGHCLRQTFAPLGRVVVTDRQEIAGAESYAVDLGDQAAVRALVQRVKPTVILNPAAYTAVDKAESEPDLARRVNVEAAATLAAEARALGAGLVHYSTDYVFDGSGHTARREDAVTGPLGVYGQTKLDGENAVAAALSDAVILRTSWVFAVHGQNFVETMLRFGAERDELKVVADQIGAPTSAEFLARMTKVVVERGLRQGHWRGLGGTYHLACSGETSWHGFAVEIFRQARLRGTALKVKHVLPIATEDWPTPAQRPKNSRLDCGKFRKTYDANLTSWQDALSEVLAGLPV